MGRRHLLLLLVLPQELFSVEEVLKELHAAVMGLKVPGFDKTEVIRLRVISAGCKVYKEMLARLWIIAGWGLS